MKKEYIWVAPLIVYNKKSHLQHLKSHLLCHDFLHVQRAPLFQQLPSLPFLIRREFTWNLHKTSRTTGRRKEIDPPLTWEWEWNWLSFFSSTLLHTNGWKEASRSFADRSRSDRGNIRQVTGNVNIFLSSSSHDSLHCHLNEEFHAWKIKEELEEWKVRKVNPFDSNCQKQEKKIQEKEMKKEKHHRHYLFDLWTPFLYHHRNLWVESSSPFCVYNAF